MAPYKKKLQSQTRSSKTKATHPDPVPLEQCVPGIGKARMNFKRRKLDPVESWWIAGAQADQRELFIELAHKRNEEMLATDSSWRQQANLAQLKEA